MDGWLVGLFEGEGCITRNVMKTKRWHDGSEYVAWGLAFSTTDRDVMERWVEWIGDGVGRVSWDQRPPSMKHHHKTKHTWTAGKRSDVVTVLERLRPGLGQRRGELADECLMDLRVRLARNPHGGRLTRSQRNGSDWGAESGNAPT